MRGFRFHFSFAHTPGLGVFGFKLEFYLQLQRVTMCPFKNVPLGQFLIIIGGKVNHHLFPCPLNMSISEQTHVTSLKVKPTRHTPYFYRHTHTTRATEV